ncbi:MAG: hypothetical protein ACRDQ2_19680 [Gaiellales bacterium]
MSYARPLTKSYAYGSLDRKWRRFPQDRRDLASMHKKLMVYRNTMLAHNDLPPQSHAARNAVVFPAGQLLREAFVTEERSSVDMDGIAVARDLAEFQRERMNAELAMLLARLQEIHGWTPDQEVRL